MSAGPKKTLEGVIDKIARSLLLKVNTSAPARIVSYDHGSQSCSIEPLVAQRIIVESDEVVPEHMPIINDVPVVFPGSGKHARTWVLQPGDIVLAIFTQRSIAKWSVTGGKVDPGDSRTHNHNDAIAIPGLRPLGELGELELADDAMVETFAGEYRIGSSTASDGVVRQSDNARIASALETAIGVLTAAPILGTTLSTLAAIDIAIAAASPTGAIPDPPTVITLGYLKAALVVDPAVGALQALKDALDALGFPSSSSRVKLE